MVIKQGISTTDEGRGALSSSYDVMVKLGQGLRSSECKIFKVPDVDKAHRDALTGLAEHSAAGLGVSDAVGVSRPRARVVLDFASCSDMTVAQVT